MLRTLIVVAVVLPAVVRGAPECDGGDTESSVVNDEILKNINARRSSVIQGKQKNGQGQDMLPPGKYMTQIYWSCDLEKAAKGGTNADCSKPTAPSGNSGFYWSDYDDSKVPASFTIENWLARIDDIPLTEYKNGAVKYSGEAASEFANLINPEATEIGCAFGSCTDGESMYTFYCLTNKDPLASGDTIYEEGAGGCENCPAGTTCDDTTKLCSKGAAPTTVPTTTSTTTTSTTSTTTSTTTTTTTTGEAIYPTGANTRCPNYVGMTDELRMHYLDTHNFRRRDLANGTIPKNNGNLLPKAANMIKLELDCDLEAGAIAHASTCPTAVSDPMTREGIGEHYHRVPISSSVPTPRDGIKHAVTTWWKVVRQYAGIGMQAIFRATHVGTPIETFTQMGWAKTSKLGCSIVTCKSDYVVICRYYPKGNIVEQNVYIPGTPCTQCMGTCYTDLLLCSA